MKYADDIVNIMNDRGSINVPEDCTTGEEFDKWMHRANQGGRGMTREEAIELLDNLIGMVEDNHNSNYDTALQMAIKALEHEPCEDAVSREFLLRDLLLKAQGEKDVSIKWLEEYINSLPSVIKQKYIECEVLDKVRAEIDKQEKWLLLLHKGYTAYNVDIAFSAIKSVLKECEVEE